MGKNCFKIISYLILGAFLFSVQAVNAQENNTIRGVFCVMQLDDNLNLINTRPCSMVEANNNMIINSDYYIDFSYLPFTENKKSLNYKELWDIMMRGY